MKSQYTTIEQVTNKLKAIADKENEANMQAYRQLARHDADARFPKAISYRKVAGDYKAKDGIFTNSTGKFYFNPLTLQASSYSWWSMLTIVKGKLIRNRCDYSMSTTAHQGRLDQALNALGIKPDFTVYTRANIGNVDDWKSDELFELASLMVRLNHCRADSKKFYQGQIKRKLAEVQAIGAFKFTKAEIKAAVAKRETERSNRLQYLKERKQAKLEADRAKELASMERNLRLVIDQE